jgi:hypothetical protein
LSLGSKMDHVAGPTGARECSHRFMARTIVPLRRVAREEP